MPRISPRVWLFGKSFKFLRHSSIAGLPAAGCSAKMEQAFLVGTAVTWFGLKMALTVGVLMILTGATRAQTLTDLGATAPIPGTIDIAQLSTLGNQTAPDGLNYYTDNAVNNPTVGEPGQTFVTGGNCGDTCCCQYLLRPPGWVRTLASPRPSPITCIFTPCPAPRPHCCTLTVRPMSPSPTATGCNGTD